ncbi:MAG: ABC transporter substrate-binding protein [Planctomycetes bacterium]|nr:ABC transporter substrate-binding protein [Planctomycetota bacterium]
MIRSRIAPLVLCAVALLTTGCPPADGGKTDDGDYSIIVGGDGVFSPDYVKLAEGAAEGSYIITPYINDTSSPGIKAFSEAFIAEYKQEPDAWAALTYDAVGTIAVAIEKAGKPDRKGIRDALAAMNSKETGYPGVTGVTFFDKNGDCAKPALIAEVKGGKLTKSATQIDTSSAGEAKAGGDKAAKKAEGEPIVIGVAGPFTGGGQKYGEMIKAGAKLKLAELNAAGGVLGRPLKIVWGDDESTNSKAVNVANDFAARPELCAVVGHFNSTCSLAAKAIYKAAEIPALTPGSTNVKVCEGSDWYFRNLYRDDFQGFICSDFITKSLKKKTCVVFFDDDDYGTGLKTFFEQRAKETGLEVLESISYDKKSVTEFTSLVTKAKSKAPEVIFIAGNYKEAALIAKACKKAGLTK